MDVKNSLDENGRIVISSMIGKVSNVLSSSLVVKVGVIIIPSNKLLVLVTAIDVG